jgi:hypothetical protein
MIAPSGTSNGHVGSRAWRARTSCEQERVRHRHGLAQLARHAALWYRHRVTSDEALRRGREAFESRGRHDAHAGLSAAERDALLEPDDLERLATAAYLLAKDAEATAAWARAHHGFSDRGQWARAARRGFWLSVLCLLRGAASEEFLWQYVLSAGSAGNPRRLFRAVALWFRST